MQDVVVTFRKTGSKPYQVVIRPGQKLCVGRGPECGIHLFSSDISTRHIEFYVEAPHSGIPSYLKVVAPNGPEFVVGTYAIVAGEEHNGFPLWRKIDDSYWIYSMTSQKWGFGGLREKDVGFKSSSAYVYCPLVHEGNMPSSMGATWKRNNPIWTDDASLLVTAFSPAVAPLLRVRSPNGPAGVEGLYALLEDERPNGFPAWKKMDAELWLFSLSTQQWGIGGVAEKLANFNSSGACVFSSVLHNGRMPESMGRSWKRNNPAWTDDSQIVVSSTTFGNADLFSSSVDAHISSGPMRCFVRDTSTNGTGIMGASEHDWRKLTKGKAEEISASGETMFVVPFHSKSGKRSIEFTVQILEDRVPDPYDVRTRAGRWKYGDKLGEGALGVVYRAFDATACICKSVGDLTFERGEQCTCFGSDSHGFALKILKEYQRERGKRLRRAYILHREAQWSLQVLHNPKSRGYCPRHAAMFAKYLEDHTGACSWTDGVPDWQKERAVFEEATFKWAEFIPSNQHMEIPYVVMEFVPGHNVHILMGFSVKNAPSDNVLTKLERILLLTQAAEALDYLTNFGLVHRDFRTTNLLWVGRGNFGRLSVIDLGLMLFADESHIKNKSAVVRVNWRGTDKNPFDWAPDEVRIGSARDFENFALPAYSFDIFSLAALAIQLETGNVKVARETIAAFASGRTTVACVQDAVGLNASTLKLMLGHASQRPHPRTVLMQLQGSRVTSKSVLKSQSMSTRGRSRSRSRLRRCSLDL